MKCKRIQQQLLDYSEELLEQKDRACIEEHLQTCPECRQELYDIKKTIYLLQSVPLEEPPETFWSDFTANVMRKINKMNTIPTTSRAVFFFPNFKMAAVAAAVLVVILGSIFLYYSETFQQWLHPTEFTAQHSEPYTNELVISGTPAVETIIKSLPPELVSEELMDDILEAEFALVDGEILGVFDVNNSDEMLYFLISTLSEEEKDRLLSELYKMK